LQSNLSFFSFLQPERSGLWSQISSFNPQSIVLLGDSMYADKRGGVLTPFIAATPKDIAEGYRLLNNDADFQTMVEKVGGWRNIAATFDDHDFGINNGDKSYAFVKESQQLFWDFSQEASSSYKRKQSGVYSSKVFAIDLTDSTRQSQQNGSSSSGNKTKKTTFTYKIIMLDTRSNRENTPSSSHQTTDALEGVGDFLGEEQWAWLTEELKSDVDLVLLGSSIQVFPTDKLTEEVWGMFLAARERLLSAMINARSSNVLVLSGDVHYAEVSKIKCTWQESINENIIQNKRISKTFWELTSSGLTHTFYRRAQLKSALLKKDDSTPRAVVLEEITELWPRMKSFIYNIYQATFPSHYREQRYGDHFSGLNFGLLDINIDTYQNDVEGEMLNGYIGSDGSFSMTCANNGSVDCVPYNGGTHKVVNSVTFRAVNHLGQTVIQKNIPLNARKEHTSAQVENIVCVPFWGPVPIWRTGLMYFMVFAPIVLLFIILPLVLISAAVMSYRNRLSLPSSKKKKL
jgi:PhoD-like phosphatase